MVVTHLLEDRVVVGLLVVRLQVQELVLQVHPDKVTMVEMELVILEDLVAVEAQVRQDRMGELVVV